MWQRRQDLTPRTPGRQTADLEFQRGSLSEKLLFLTPKDAANLIGLKFTAEYRQCVFVPCLKTYRHVLRIKDGNSPLVHNIAKVMNAHNLKEEATVKILPNGGVDLLVSFEAEHPFGTYDWEIRTCQIYKDPKYLLLYVKRLQSVDENIGSFLRTPSVYDVYTSLREFCKILVLTVCVIFDSVVQVTWATQRIVSVLMEGLPRLITAIMPLLLAIVDGLTKCIGGFYLMIVLLFGRERPPQIANPGFDVSYVRRSSILSDSLKRERDNKRSVISNMIKTKTIRALPAPSISSRSPPKGPGQQREGEGKKTHGPRKPYSNDFAKKK